MSSTAFARFDESFFETLPPTAPAWPGSTPEQLDFMRRVYAAHVARAKSRGGRYVADIPAGELARVETSAGPRMRTAAAADCRAMLADARAALAVQKAAGSALANGVLWIGITSGYRSASEQFALWQKYFPRFYRETQSRRAAAPGGPHGDHAVALTVKHVGAWIAAPGFSLHNDGRAADLKTSERGLTLGASSKHRKPWRETWFWAWLVANAAQFHFFQNTSIDEPWHWEHRPERAHGEFQSAPVIAAGEKAIGVVPLLAKHRGSGPGVVLRWNNLTRTDEIDVAIHFHGYASQLGKMDIVKHKLPMSGLDWQDPDHTQPGQRTRPTLFILPHGHYDPAKRTDRYTFPALYPKPALRELWTWALAQLTAHLGLSQTPRVARLILTAHSGGGAALEHVMANYDPDEVHLFDAAYQPMENLTRWARRHIDADARAVSGAPGGALRVLHLNGTAHFSQALGQAMRTAMHGRPNAVQLAKRYRIEKAAVGHNDIPRRYGWQLFADSSADVR